MTEGEKKARYEQILATHGDPKVVTRALSWLQLNYPDEYGASEPSHQLPLRPEQEAKVAREQAAGQLPGPTFKSKVAAGFGVPSEEPGYSKVDRNFNDDAYRGNEDNTLEDLSRGSRNMLSGLTLGASSAIADYAGADSPQARAGANPGLGTALHGVGGGLSAMAPGGPVNVIGRGVGGLVGMAEQRVPAMAGTALGRVAGQTAAGGVTGGLVSGLEANAGGATPGQSFEAAGKGALLGGAFSFVPSAIGEGGQGLANRIRGADPNLQALEGAGYTTSPMPFRPTTSTRGGPASPSEAQGVPATATGRGLQGERAGSAIQDELGHLRTLEGRRAGTELGAATDKQGGRSMSVEPDIALIDAELAKPEIAMNGRMRTALANARKMLTGEMEPTADIFKMVEAPGPSRGPPQTAVPRYEDARLQRQLGLELDRESGPAVRVSENGTPLEPQVDTVGTGDVHGRVGEAPNHVRDAKTLNQIRDALETAMGTEQYQARGNSAAPDMKPVLPLYRLVSQMRQRIRSDAPAIGLANRRSAGAKRKFEATDQRLADNTDKPETLGSQIASLGDDSVAAGVRTPRLGDPEQLTGPERGKNLREQFPQSRLREPFNPDVEAPSGPPQVGELMDRPRLLGAEEAQQFKPSLAPHRNVGPLVNRLVYPVARGAGTAFGGMPAEPASAQLPGSSTPGGRPLGAPQYGNAPEGLNIPLDLELNLNKMLPAVPPPAPATKHFFQADPRGPQSGALGPSLLPSLVPELYRVFQDPRVLEEARRSGLDIRSLFQSLPTAQGTESRHR